MIPSSLKAWIEEALSRSTGEEVRILQTQSVSGGCINRAAILLLSTGVSVFAKWHDSPPEAFFTREAEGLRTLRAHSPLFIPEVLGLLEDKGLPQVLLLENVKNPLKEPGNRPRSRQADEELGHGLALQHRTSRSRFGFHSDNFIGTTPQRNTWCDDWPEFFRTRRLDPLLHTLVQQGRLDVPGRHLFDRLASRLEALITTEEPPALLHGDLWSGNIISTRDNRPALVDPAVYYGHREADTAYTALFGGLSSRALAAYNEAYPFPGGSEVRGDIYNLYHLLNHAVLFGGGYMAQARTVAARYA